MQIIELKTPVQVPEVGDRIQVTYDKVGSKYGDPCVKSIGKITAVCIDDLFGATVETDIIGRYNKRVYRYVSKLIWNEKKNMWVSKDTDSPFTPETVNISDSELVAKLITYDHKSPKGKDFRRKQPKVGDTLYLAQVDKEVIVRKCFTEEWNDGGFCDDVNLVEFRRVKTKKKYDLSSERDWFNSVCVHDLVWNENTQRFEYYKDCC